ncbi:MAG: hypothetical protein GX660_23300 [Clostridiaceae bacterium]|nr:hypothetical protein [Clostridiaceae bacterium]
MIFLLLALIVRFIFLEALLISDDTYYFFSAANYSPELFSGGTDQTFFRLGLLLPVALIQKLFGVNIISYYVWTISVFLLFIFTSYVLSKIINGERMAIINVLIVISSYFFLFQSSNLLPDIPCLITAIFSFIFFHLSLKNKKFSKLFLFVSVLSGFISYTIRIPNIVFLLSIPIYEILAHKSIRKSISYGLIFLLFFLVETSIYYMLTGDLFAQVRSNAENMSDWSIYMNSISRREYLFAPLKSYLSTNTGKILTLFGAFGFLLAILKKKWLLVALTISGFIIFLIYSYSVTSINPLVRALPLSQRYIISFSFVCSLCTAYFLSYILDDILRGRSNINKLFIGAISILLLVAILFLQIVELPSLLGKNAIFWGKNSYFLIDQYIKRNERYYQGKTIFAYPEEVFNLYPNIKKLNIKTLDFSRPFEPDQLALISVDLLNEKFYYANLRNDLDYVIGLETFTSMYIPRFDYIFDTGDVFFARFDNNPVKLTELIDIADYSAVGDIWMANSEAVKSVTGSPNITFELLPYSEPYYIFTFPGNWETPPEGFEEIFDKLNTEKIIHLNLIYSLEENLNSNLFFIQQYDDVARIYGESYNIETTAGTHQFEKYIKLLPYTTKLRFYIRVENLTDSVNVITLEKLQINKVEH